MEGTFVADICFAFRRKDASDFEINPLTVKVNTMAPKKQNKKITIEGYVDSVDEGDEEAGIIISTDEEEFIVEPNIRGKELADLIGVLVRVSGTVTRTKSGENRIAVNDYKILEEEDDWDDDETEGLFDDD